MTKNLNGYTFSSDKVADYKSLTTFIILHHLIEQNTAMCLCIQNGGKSYARTVDLKLVDGFEPPNKAVLDSLMEGCWDQHNPLIEAILDEYFPIQNSDKSFITGIKNSWNHLWHDFLVF